MIPLGIAESPPESSKKVCQPMILFKCVAQMSQYPEFYPFETTKYPYGLLTGTLGIIRLPIRVGWFTPTSTK